jgi:hypothetical protein
MRREAATKLKLPGNTIPPPALPVTAMARTLACLFDRLIKLGQQYVDKGTEYYEARYRKQQIRSIENRAQQLGRQLVNAKTA